MKRIINLTVICLILLIAFSGCGKKEKILNTPNNVVLSDSGLLSWDAVENAESYTVTINDKTFTTKTTSYQVQSLSTDFTYSVTANAEGYTSSIPSAKGTYQVPYTPPVDTTPEIAVAISGKSEVRYGSPFPPMLAERRIRRLSGL